MKPLKRCKLLYKIRGQIAGHGHTVGGTGSFEGRRNLRWDRHFDLKLSVEYFMRKPWIRPAKVLPLRALCITINIMDAFAIKLLASACMLVDHIGAVFYMFTPAFFRWIGRLSMPLYVCLIAQGCVKTGDINRYMCRLGVFALLSEIPFDLAFWQGYRIEEGQSPAIDFLTNTNVFYTLFFGVACINVYENARRNAGAYKIFVRSVLIKLKLRPREENRYAVTFLFVLLFIVLFFAAIFSPIYPKLALTFVILPYILFSLFAWPRIFARFNDTCETPPEGERLTNNAAQESGAQSDGTINWPALLPVLPLFAMGDTLTADYGSFAVILIFILYLAKSRKRQTAVLLCGVLAEYGAPLLRFGFSAHNVMLLLFALVSVAVILLYNGKPGIRFKWAFYGFYPGHIALLALIRRRTP